MNIPVDTGCKLNVLCTFNLRPVSAGANSCLVGIHKNVQFRYFKTSYQMFMIIIDWEIFNKTFILWEKEISVQIIR